MLNIKCFASSSKGNLYLLYNEETKILLECGLESKYIKSVLRANGMLITDLNGCLITHFHQDHCMSVEWVMEYIQVYSTHELHSKYDDIIAMSLLTPFKIGTIKILPIPIEHGKAENNAFVFMDKDNCIFFGTDFSLMEQNIGNFKFSKVFIECNYDDELLQRALDNEDNEFKLKHIRQVSTHMSKENCKLHLRNMDLSQCKEIVLLHPSAFLIGKEKTKQEFEQEFRIKTYFAREK